jgi:signal transduction histidine kinase
MESEGLRNLLGKSLRSLSPVTITGLYVLFGVLWITFSDSVAAAVVATRSELTTVQTLKGWLFIGLSGAIILGLLEMQQEAISKRETKLARQSEQLQVFNRVLRHNIRNELSLILGRLDFEAGERADFPASVLEDLDTIERSAQRILRVAEKARRVDQFDLDSHEETTDLAAMIQSEVDSLREEYPDTTLETDLPEYVPVSTRGTISIAIHELVENAIIHNDAPENANVTVKAETALTSAVEIEVTDDGPGIEESEVRPIVDGEETPLEHGSSLGLWLTRWVVKNHGGELTLSGSTDGTTARIVLPVEPVPQLKSSIPMSLPSGR